MSYKGWLVETSGKFLATPNAGLKNKQIQSAQDIDLQGQKK